MTFHSVGSIPKADFKSDILPTYLPLIDNSRLPIHVRISRRKKGDKKKKRKGRRKARFQKKKFLRPSLCILRRMFLYADRILMMLADTINPLFYNNGCQKRVFNNKDFPQSFTSGIFVITFFLWCFVLYCIVLCCDMECILIVRSSSSIQI